MRMIVKNNEKGFSLVELIIVIAIMVALVALMAPTFVKYVNSARDSVLQESAENVLEMVKGEYACEHLNVTSGNSKVAVYVFADDEGSIKIAYNPDKLSYEDNGNTLESICGVDTSKKCLSKKVYRIDVNENNEGRIFAMEETDGAIRSTLLTGNYSSL